VVADRDRTELIRRSEMGAVGLAGMGLLFGIWRWRASKIKTCSSCGTRIATGAAVCKRCFRAV
jgi:ribosomal protein L40E